MAMSAAELPVGFRFHPTGEELVNYYLKKKIQGKDFDNIIPEIDIYKCEPWDLPRFSPIKSDDDEWLYFSRPNYKSKNRGHVNRATKNGFWKITSREREIKARESKAVIGKKRTLTFYLGKVRSGQKTNWVIHEYYIPEYLLPNAAKQRDFVLCRLKKKDEITDNGACDEGEPSTNNTSDFENPIAIPGRTSTPEENSRPEEIFETLFPSPESPQSHDYFSSMLREDILQADAGSDDHSEMQFAFGDGELFVNSIWADENDYYLEESSRTTLLHHSSEPKSLSRVHFEAAHKQYTSKVPDKPKAPMLPPMAPPKPPPMARRKEQGQSLEPPSNDEQKGMKQKQTGRMVSDWKGSFIVWKESPLSLKSYPPVVYTFYMILGLFLFRFFAGEVVSYGKWY